MSKVMTGKSRAHDWARVWVRMAEHDVKPGCWRARRMLVLFRPYPCAGFAAFAAAHARGLATPPGKYRLFSILKTPHNEESCKSRRRLLGEVRGACAAHRGPDLRRGRRHRRGTWASASAPYSVVTRRSSRRRRHRSPRPTFARCADRFASALTMSGSIHPARPLLPVQ